MSPQRCDCGHTTSQHELRGGGLLGCYISGCLCIDFYTSTTGADAFEAWLATQGQPVTEQVEGFEAIR